MTGDVAAPVRALVEILACAKRGDVSAATAVDLHCAELDRNQLASVLRLLFPFVVELYSVRDAALRWDAAETEAVLGPLDFAEPDVGGQQLDE